MNKLSAVSKLSALSALALSIFLTAAQPVSAQSCESIFRAAAADSSEARARELRFVERAKIFSAAARGSGVRQRIQHEELTRILDESARTLETHLARHSARAKSMYAAALETQRRSLRTAFESGQLTDEFSVDWGYRQAKLISLAEAGRAARAGEPWVEHATLLNLSYTKSDWEKTEGNVGMPLETVLAQLQQISYVEYLRTRFELKDGESLDLDVLVTDQELSPDAFNQMIGQPTQFVGFIYASLVYDGLPRAGTPLAFFTHDFTHFQLARLTRLGRRRYASLTKRFVEAYNRPQLSLRAKKALEMATFMSDHEEGDRDGKGLAGLFVELTTRNLTKKQIKKRLVWLSDFSYGDYSMRLTNPGFFGAYVKDVVDIENARDVADFIGEGRKLLAEALYDAQTR